MCTTIKNNNNNNSYNNMMPNDLTSGHTKTRNVTSLVLVLLPLMMFLLASLQIILASPSDKWDENIRPILVTDYLKDKNAGKKIKASMIVQLQIIQVKVTNIYAVNRDFEYILAINMILISQRKFSMLRLLFWLMKCIVPHNMF